MTTEQKLEIVKRAIELGADVEVKFFASRTPRTKREAHEIAKHFPEFKITDLGGSLWLRKSIKKPSADIEGAVFYG